ADRRPAQRLARLDRVDHRQLRPDVEQLPLHPLEEVAAVRLRLEGERQPDHRVELVHLPICLYAEVILRHPLPAAQAGLSGIARPSSRVPTKRLSSDPGWPECGSAAMNGPRLGWPCM